MFRIYAFLLFFSEFTFNIIAQPVLTPILNHSIGQQWGFGIASDLENLSRPEEGANITWDFRFVGDLDNGFGTSFSLATMEDFTPLSFEDASGLTLEDGRTILDSFPDAVGIRYIGEVGNREGILLSETTSTIQELGDVSELNGQIHIENKYTQPVFWAPRGMSFGELNSYQSLDVSTDLDFNEIDSTTYTDTVEYVGYGNLHMYYGDLANVVCYKRKSEIRSSFYDLDTGLPTAGGVFVLNTYEFYQADNLLPILIFQEIGANVQLIVFVPFFDPSSTNEQASSTVLSFRTSPNPNTTAHTTVEYALQDAHEVSMQFISVDGRKLMQKTLGYRNAGQHSETLVIPAELPNGTYFLHLTAGNQKSITKLSLQR